MKKYILLLFCILSFQGCRSSQESPEKIAWGFLHAYYTNDFEGAIRYADEETKEYLESTYHKLLSDGITPQEMKTLAKPVIIEVEGVIANDGYRAVCAYKLKNSSDDANAMIETLMLFKTDDGWKVSF